jgi:hypothetical protein
MSQLGQKPRLRKVRFWRKADIGQDKKRSKSRGGRAKQAAPAAWRLSIVFSTAAHGLINMAVSVSHQDRCCCAYSRLSDGCDERCTMIMNYLPLISATVIMLVILAFAAEASSQ